MSQPNAAIQRALANERARAALAPGATPQGIPAVSDVVKYLKQYTGYPLSLPLDNGDYRKITLRLRATLTTAATSATDEYKVPTTYALLIHSIRGDVAFNNPDGETLNITGIGNPMVLDRIALKAMNCTASLVNRDRSDEKIIGEKRDVPLSALMDLVGGKPEEYDPPHIVLGGQTLQGSFALTDTGASIVGASTDYGFVINATLVRTRKG